MEGTLRPMSTSQVLDRTFHLYRNNFVLFAGIAIITPALQLIAQLVQLRVFGPLTMPRQPEALTPQFFQGFFVRVIIAGIVGAIVYLIGTSLASSATAYAVSMVHLGKPTTIVEAYKKVRPIFFKIMWLLLLILFFTIGPFLLIYFGLVVSLVVVAMVAKGAGGPNSAALIGVIIVGLVGLAALFGAVGWMIYCLCRYALAVTASTLEKLPAGKSLRRSRALTDGAKWSVLGIVILTFLMTFAVTYALQLPALLVSGSFFVTAKSHLTMASTVWIYFAGFLGNTIAGPVTTIALVLVYYNQRVRKEAFDLQLMMEAVGEENQMQAAAAAAAAAPIPPAIG
jgi:hypothetical protein